MSRILTLLLAAAGLALVSCESTKNAKPDSCCAEGKGACCEQGKGACCAEHGKGAAHKH